MIILAIAHLDKVKVWGKPIRVTQSKHAVVQMPKEGQPVSLPIISIISCLKTFSMKKGILADILINKFCFLVALLAVQNGMVCSVIND